MPWNYPVKRAQEQKHGIRCAASQREVPEDVILSQGLRWVPIYPVHPSATQTRLEKPVVIPRVTPNIVTEHPLPFLRAYSYVLQSHDVHGIDFMKIVDQLSLVQATHPPSQMEEIGMGAGTTPYHWAHFAGIGSRVGAKIGDTALLMNRTKRFIEHVNKLFLRPRGLQMTIMTDEDVSKLLAIPRERELLSPLDPEMTYKSVRQRRMSALRDYIAELTLEVPQPSQERSLLDAIASEQIESHRIKQEMEHTELNAQYFERLFPKSHSQSDSGLGGPCNDTGSDSSFESCDQDAKFEADTVPGAAVLHYYSAVSQVVESVELPGVQWMENPVSVAQEAGVSVWSLNEVEGGPRSTPGAQVSEADGDLQQELAKMTEAVSRLEYIVIDNLDP